MQRLITIIGLQFYALALVALQMHFGVRTDEAKYLLDIPYPHPPLARFIFSLLDGWAYQELFWRVVLATLVIQAVWLVMGMAKPLGKNAELAAAACWLLSAAVIAQAGTVMMAPLTALQALVFVWLFMRPQKPSRDGSLVALFWLLSLLTAYQAVLFAPLVWAVLARGNGSLLRRGLLFVVPVVVLGLYTLTNPLVPASMLVHAGKDAAETLPMHLVGTLKLWLIGGSIVFSVFGTVGLLIRPKAGLLLSLLLVGAYVFIARYDYYAILFTPLLTTGFILRMQAWGPFKQACGWMSGVMAGLVLGCGTALSLWLVPWSVPTIIPHVIAAIDAHPSPRDTVLINGSFGHEWQQATRSIVRRYDLLFLDLAHAVICLTPCPDMAEEPQWTPLPDLPIDVYVFRP